MLMISTPTVIQEETGDALSYQPAYQAAKESQDELA